MKRFFGALVFICSLVFSSPSYAQELTDEQTQEAITFAQRAATYVLYHEIGHLFVAQYELPILGREEDVADNIATLMLLLAENEEKDNILLDSAHSWFLSNDSATDDVISDAEFYDSHSLDIQRAFQIICLMVGADPELFAEVATQVGIDDDRQESCQYEFAQLTNNWLRLSEAFIKKTSEGAKIEAIYEPSDEEFEYAAAIFQNGEILEFVAKEIEENYSLPAPARFIGKNCGTANAYYDPSTNDVVMCYELTAMFLDLIVEDILRYPEG